MIKPLISCDEGAPFVDDGPIYFICVDDQDDGNVAVYVRYLPETHDDDGEADRDANFEYDPDRTETRADARSHAEALASCWADEIRRKWPCDWGTNY